MKTRDPNSVFCLRNTCPNSLFSEGKERALILRRSDLQNLILCFFSIYISRPSPRPKRMHRADDEEATVKKTDHRSTTEETSSIPILNTSSTRPSARTSSSHTPGSEQVLSITVSTWQQLTTAWQLSKQLPSSATTTWRPSRSWRATNIATSDGCAGSRWQTTRTSSSNLNGRTWSLL